MSVDITFRIHVSADQQYQLFVDEVFTGRGCEQKSPENWYFESYDLTLEKGHHSLSALVWNYGDFSPMNRMSLFPGFILISDLPYTSLLGTGIAPWRVKFINTRSFNAMQNVKGAWMSVAPYEKYDFNKIHSENWLEPNVLEQGTDVAIKQSYDRHCLVPSPLREFNSDEISFHNIIIFDNYDNGQIPSGMSKLSDIPRIFPSETEKRIIIDLGNYYCAFSKLKINGGKGSQIRITWAETAFSDPEKPVKGNRNSLAGKYFRGVWDEVVLDGNTHEWSPLAWRCGRFVELHISTSNETLELERFSLQETRYPLEMDGDFECNDKFLNNLIPFCFRTLQMSAHDNFVDCPFYEQLLYAGDGRLEAQVNLAACKDDALVKKAITTLALSRDTKGFTMARWPSRSRQYIPSFSLWWIAMLHDFALWRDDKAFIKSHMATMRTLLDNFLGRINEDGFLHGKSGEWNFIDWVDDWYRKSKSGTPPGIESSVNATYNWLFVYILGLAEKLEYYAGDDNTGKRWKKTADELSEKILKRFWLQEKGLFNEDDSGKHFSEHAQILAILSGKLEDEYIKSLKKSLLKENKLAKCSIFYKHYLCEAYAALDLPERIISEFELWNTFLKKGFKTVPETPENRTFNQRSDCHGWGSHPIYHLITNIAGIKPANMGFEKVTIKPRMGQLRKLQAKCVHPQGMISLFLKKEPDALKVKISLPPGITGDFFYEKNTIELKSTENNFPIKVNHT